MAISQQLVIRYT